MLPFCRVSQELTPCQLIHPSSQQLFPSSAMESVPDDVEQEELRGLPDTVVELKVSVASGAVVATIKASLATLVIEVKREIARQEGTPAWKQQLLFGHTLLDDLKPLGRYSSFTGEDEDNIMLVRSAPFIPANRAHEFLELPELNYIFKHGEQGLGYYIDENQGGWTSLPVWRSVRRA
mmetsp:Transcript_22109/g.40636  ORF Transcript_22109/g.40636 Transcript_22109/m.40636 type:complete len:178 (-) Transcript_22109:195-728(-)